MCIDCRTITSASAYVGSFVNDEDACFDAAPRDSCLSKRIRKSAMHGVHRVGHGAIIPLEQDQIVGFHVGHIIPTVAVAESAHTRIPTVAGYFNRAGDAVDNDAVAGRNAASVADRQRAILRARRHATPSLEKLDAAIRLKFPDSAPQVFCRANPA